MKIFKLLLILVAMGVRVAVADAQETIFLVRHAEQAGPGIEDVPLTEVGRRRAKVMATVLKDAGIDAIFVSKGILRTLQTAEPVAKALNIKIKVHSRNDPDGLISRLRTEHAQDRVLIVNHIGTMPMLLWALGHHKEVRIARLDYDNLFMIVPKSDGDPLVLRLHY